MSVFIVGDRVKFYICDPLMTVTAHTGVIKEIHTRAEDFILIVSKDKDQSIWIVCSKQCRKIAVKKRVWIPERYFPSQGLSCVAAFSCTKCGTYNTQEMHYNRPGEGKIEFIEVRKKP